MSKKMYQKTFTLSSVNTSSTGSEETMNIGYYQGTIKNIIVACSSTDFDVSIRDRQGQGGNSVYVILNYVGNNLRLAHNDVNCEFRNRDATISGNLYAVIKNDDASNATGSIEVSLMIEGDYK